ncbi:hypothetical protein GE300_09840 [Rhodobacteraceae bacterium 2CG4]|uniref:Parvulin-like PPIase n=1 Tax=Halovulum marinum TaxID=2662447 RepID=A0A6L5Z087_9RHOB|nr:peptidyl-prolyl cis-trans isomerase [Halovulum marinum]MSU89908.1 hypothetical protein [Halovulum marinum]
MLNRFRSSTRGKGTSIVVWALLGLLIVGLTGLGLGGAVSSLSTQNVATVGSEKVAREDYVRQLLRQIDSLAQRTGQRFTMQQARSFGLDQQVLGQMLTRAALDGEVDDLGLSVPDEMVRDALIDNPAFQGLANGFDAQSYEFFLDRQGLSAKDYEEEVRADLSRALVEVAVAGGVAMPPAMADALLAWQNESRSFATLQLSPRALEQPVPAPTDAQVQAFYEAREELYTRPETRVVSHATLTPAMLAGTVEISEDALRAAYDARSDRYSMPERRIVDLIAFESAEAAQAAREAIDAGESSFDALAEQRGLTADDLSLGAIGRGALSAEAREAVFGADGPGVVGPVDSDLGPALYRVNAILAARETPFEQARDELRAELAAAKAQDGIAEWYEPVQDLLAAGATLEEIAEETALEFGETGLTDQPGEGLAGDTAFRDEAFAAEPGEPRDLIELSGGGIAVLRVERIEPPALRPLDEVRAQVEADWREAEVQARLTARAEELKALLDEGQTLAKVSDDSGLGIARFGPLTRADEPAAGLPADLLQQVFALDEGDSAVIAEPGSVYLVQVTDVTAADPDADSYAQQREALQRQLQGALSSDLFDAYARMLIDGKPISVNQTLIDETLAQYP